LKCLATGFDASLSFLSTSRRCSLNRSPSRRPVSPMYIFLQCISFCNKCKFTLVLELKVCDVICDVPTPDWWWSHDLLNIIFKKNAVLKIIAEQSQ